MRASSTLVLLVLALTFSVLSVQAADCLYSGSSVGTLSNSFYCNCWAGYSPNYDLGTNNCGVRADVTTCGTSAEDATTSGTFAPELVNAATNPVSFSKDLLTLSFTQPLSQTSCWQVTSATISFYKGTTSQGTPGSTACAYPGPLWGKVAGKTSCSDRYTFIMPWSSHDTCGFQKIATPSTLTYVTTIEFTYVLTCAGQTRTLSNLFNVNIQLLRQQLIQASLSVAVANTQEVEVNAAVVGTSVYDLLNGQLRVVFQTKTTFPYQVGSPITKPAVAGPVVESVPANVAVQLGPDYLSADNCPGTPGSFCVQQFEAIISSSTGLCDYHGDYIFGTKLVCSDNELCTPISGPNVTIKLDHTDVCSAPQVDTGILTTQTLTSYGDAALTLPRSDFETGDQTFWAFTIVDPLVSIDSIKINTIALSLSDTHMTSGTDIVLGPGVVTSSVVSGIKEASGTFPPGTPVVTSFQLSLNRQNLANTLSIINPTSTSVVNMNLLVAVDITYHGNQKRTISLAARALDNGGALSSVSSFVVRSKPSDSEPKPNSNTNNCTGFSFSCVVLPFFKNVLSALGL